MSTTIRKEVEIELEYDDIRDAVSDLSSQEQSTLVNECELINLDSVIDWIDESDSNDKEEILSRCSLIDEDSVSEFIDGMDTDDVKSMIESSSHSEILKSDGNSETNDTYSNFLEIVRKNVNENDMGCLLERSDELTILIKAMVVVLAKK